MSINTTGMTLDELILALYELRDNTDTEEAHGLADDLLLKYIANEAVTGAFNQVPKWYA